MSKILEEIKNLQEAFITLVEGRKEGESTEDFKHRLHGERVRDIDKKAGKAKEELLAGKGSYEKYKKEHDKLGKLDDIEPVANAYIEVKENADIMTQILDLTEAYANLLEAKDQRGRAQKEVNKITRTKKDKNGEPVEVVSVADELFPYKGTAKEQYNQKILAKINDMIEGTATLDDLIQLVRSKKPTIKESLQETLDRMMTVTGEIVNEVSKDFIGPKLEKGNKEREKINAEKDEVIDNPDSTEEEKDEAAKKAAEYNCKATNITNKAFDYIKNKIDKNKK